LPLVRQSFPDLRCLSLWRYEQTSLFIPERGPGMSGLRHGAWERAPRRGGNRSPLGARGSEWRRRSRADVVSDLQPRVSDRCALTGFHDHETPKYARCTRRRGDTHIRPATRRKAQASTPRCGRRRAGTRPDAAGSGSSRSGRKRRRRSRPGLVKPRRKMRILSSSCNRCFRFQRGTRAMMRKRRAAPGGRRQTPRH